MTTLSKSEIFGRQLIAEMPAAEDLKELFSALGTATESLKQSHDHLGRRVQDLESELAQKNRALERKDRLEALGKIAAGVAHEIRNPLGSILLYLDLLENVIKDRQKALDHLDRIRKGVSHLSAIVSDILTFTEPGEAQYVPCDIVSLLEESISLATAGRDASLAIQRFFPEKRRTVLVDPDWLRRICLNLIRNACQAMHNRGELTVRFQYGGEVTIVIEDTGPGIPADELEKVFLPFWSRKDNGTGLGLSIVHSLIERLNGRIELKNRKIGGLQSIIYLPSLDDAQCVDEDACEKEEGTGD